MNRIALDLEMWADQGIDKNGNAFSKVERVIQIGVTAFDPVSGKILETDGWYVKIDKPLSKYIIGLTGITQETLDEHGMSFIEAYNKLIEFSKKHNCWNQLVTWGSDRDQLKEELDIYHSECEDYTGQDYDDHTHSVVHTVSFDGQQTSSFLTPKTVKWVFGWAECNVKPLYQATRLAIGENHSGGLGKSMKKIGLTFIPYVAIVKGRIKQFGAHDARTDSLNTAIVYLRLLEKIKGDKSE